MRLLLVAMLLCCGCASTGVFLSYNKTGLALVQVSTEFGEVLSSAPPLARGKACSINILGIVSSGDSSIAAAAAQGGVRRISFIDYEITRVLGFYGQLCTIVSGSDSASESSEANTPRALRPIVSIAPQNASPPAPTASVSTPAAKAPVQGAGGAAQDQQDAITCRDATRRLCFLRYRARLQADATFPETGLAQSMSRAMCYLPRDCLADWPDEGDPGIREVDTCPDNDPNCLPAAAHYLATYGRGSDDLTVAMRLYLASCQQGAASSCTDYGVLLMISSEAADRQAMAHTILTQACDRNDARACAILGFMALEQHDEAHKEQAKTLLLKACGQKQAEACRQLSTLAE